MNKLKGEVEVEVSGGLQKRPEWRDVWETAVLLSDYFLVDTDI